MAAVAAATEEQYPSLLSRLDRLDIMMGYLEEMKTSRAIGNSFASTTSSGTGTATTLTTSELGGNSSVNSSPKSVGEAVTETQKKGNLIERVSHLEDSVMNLSLQVEKGNNITKEEKMISSLKSSRDHNKRWNKLGLKHLVKSCVKGGDVMTKD